MDPKHAADDVAAEAASRRTFAIISHPDAGKTTLTEKLLLYSGAVEEAGAVKARRGRRAAASDWMALERARGISVTSTVLRFRYRDAVLNLLDTPGHRDFSEDTYRVLSAADAAVMVLDAAKGVEPQTLKLFEVCAARGTPVITFLNKLDRPGREALELLDEIEARLDTRATPVTWPIGHPGDLRGVIDRRDGSVIRYTRTARGATMAPEERADPATVAAEEGDAWAKAVDESALLDAVGADLDLKSFLAGESTPVFAGSALTNFGVRLLLDALVDLAPAPRPLATVDGGHRDLGTPFSGFVFKVQANMDPRHRDRVAFVRACSGRFERGMTLVHGRTGRTFATNYAAGVLADERETIDVAYPGDVVGLVNASTLRPGDSVYADDPVAFPPIPTFAPEHFATARPQRVDKTKQFHQGLTQLSEEGVIQVLRDAGGTDPVPLLGAVGPLQLEVTAYRLEHEYGCPIVLTPSRHHVARRTDAESAEVLAAERGVDVVVRPLDGVMMALFENVYRLERLQRDRPGLVLEPVFAGGAETRG